MDTLAWRMQEDKNFLMKHLHHRPSKPYTFLNHPHDETLLLLIRPPTGRVSPARTVLLQPLDPVAHAAEFLRALGQLAVYVCRPGLRCRVGRGDATGKSKETRVSETGISGVR